MKKLLLVCVFIAGCDNGSKFADAAKALQKGCEIPISLEIQQGAWGPSATAKCEKLKSFIEEPK